MSDDEYAIGEIRIFAGDYIPSAWLACNGQALPIGVYEELFQAIGGRFGGDQVTSFAVPNLPDPGPGLKYIICYFGVFITTGSWLPGTLAEVRLFANQGLPANWLPCAGQVLRIDADGEYSEALFVLLNTRFGGNGQTTFGIPNIANPIGGAQYMICFEGEYPSAS